MSKRFIPDKTNHWVHVPSRAHVSYNYAHTHVTCVAYLVTDQRRPSLPPGQTNITHLCPQFKYRVLTHW